jgi:hypothetical protein
MSFGVKGLKREIQTGSVDMKLKLTSIFSFFEREKCLGTLVYGVVLAKKFHLTHRAVQHFVEKTFTAPW